MAAPQTATAERRDRTNQPERSDRQDRNGRHEPAAVKNARQIAVSGTVVIASALLLGAQLLSGFGWLSWPAIVIAASVLAPLGWKSFSTVAAMQRSIGLCFAGFIAAAVWFYGIIQLQQSLHVGLLYFLMPAAAFGLFHLANDIRRSRQRSEK